MEQSSPPCSKVGCSRRNYYYNINECLSPPHTAAISYHITSYLPPQLGFQNVIVKTHDSYTYKLHQTIHYNHHIYMRCAVPKIIASTPMKNRIEPLPAICLYAQNAMER